MPTPVSIFGFKISMSLWSLLIVEELPLPEPPPPTPLLLLRFVIAMEMFVDDEEDVHDILVVCTTLWE